jgi:hypothetical protein
MFPVGKALDSPLLHSSDFRWLALFKSFVQPKSKIGVDTAFGQATALFVPFAFFNRYPRVEGIHNAVFEMARRTPRPSIFATVFGFRDLFCNSKATSLSSASTIRSPDEAFQKGNKIGLNA